MQTYSQWLYLVYTETGETTITCEVEKLQSVDQKYCAYEATFAVYKITSKLKKTENNSLLR